jgi:hypothetical protein
MKSTSKSSARWIAPLVLSVLVGSLAVSSRSDGAFVQRERVEISAPILPGVLKLYTTFPTTLDDEKAMAHAAALTYGRLLTECAPDYPAITLPSGGDTGSLTTAQLTANYNAVGECSYVEHTAKPYWIPKLIDDVDICGTELGAGWRLITEDDLSTLTESDFNFIQATLTPLEAGASSDASFWGTFYFGLEVWLRAKDGTIASGNLAPGVVGSRVAAIPNATMYPTQHYEGGLALRCIRRTDVP